MTDKEEGIALFQELADQAYSLQTQPKYCEEFFRWYLNVLDKLNLFLGSDSEEFLEFSNIFSQNTPYPQLLENAKRILENSLPTSLIGLVDDLDVPDSIYGKSLAHAAEILLAAKIELNKDP